MWTVVYVTQNKKAALAIKAALEKLGMLVKIKPTDRSSADQNCFEVLVPYAEVSEALNVIIDMDA